MQRADIPGAARIVGVQHGEVGVAALLGHQSAVLLGVGARQQARQLIEPLYAAPEMTLEARLHRARTLVGRRPRQQQVGGRTQVPSAERLVETHHLLLPGQRPEQCVELVGDERPQRRGVRAECAVEQEITCEQVEQPALLPVVKLAEGVDRVGLFALLAPQSSVDRA